MRRAAVQQLSIEPVDDATIQATIVDATAKAWRLTVSGTGVLGDDRWEIAVETGDVGPVIVATEIVGGKVVDEMDLSGFADGTAAAGGCHSTLPVCLDSDGFRLPDDGDGTFSVRLCSCRARSRSLSVAPRRAGPVSRSSWARGTRPTRSPGARADQAPVQRGHFRTR